MKDSPAQAAAEARRGVADLYARARNSGAVERQAEELKPAVSKGAWASFGALVLSLAAAVFGAMAGRRNYIPRASQPRGGVEPATALYSSDTIKSGVAAAPAVGQAPDPRTNRGKQ